MRGTTSTDSVPGHERRTETSATVIRSRTRSATASVSTRASGVPGGDLDELGDGGGLLAGDPDDLDVAHAEQGAPADEPDEPGDDGRRR